MLVSPSSLLDSESNKVCQSLEDEDDEEAVNKECLGSKSNIYFRLSQFKGILRNPKGQKKKESNNNFILFGHSLILKELENPLNYFSNAFYENFMRLESYLVNFDESIKSVNINDCRLYLRLLILGSTSISLRSTLRDLHLCCGRLDDFPLPVLSNISESPSSNSYLHLLFEARYTLLTSFFKTQESLHEKMVVKFQSILDSLINEDDSLNNIRQTLSLQFLIELLLISKARMKRFEYSGLEYKVPFECECLREYWLIVIEALAVLEIDFWKILLSLTETSNSIRQYDESLSSSSFICYDSIEFSSKLLWWISPHLISFTNTHHTLLLKADVLRLQNQTYDVRDSELKFICESLLKFSKLENEAFNIIVTLWDYFSKTLNFVANTIEELAMIPKNFKDWRLLKKNNDAFSIFLKIIQVKAEEKIIKRIIGRILVSLKPSYLSEFNSVGLFRLFTLFITLVIGANVSLKGKTVKSILDTFENNESTPILLKGIGGLLHLLVEEKSELTDIMTEIHRRIIQIISNHRKNPKTELTADCITVYLDVILTISENNYYFSIIDSLLNMSILVKYMEVSSESEVRRILRTLNSLATKLRRFSNDNLESFKVIFNFIQRNLALSLNCPHEEICDFISTIILNSKTSEEMGTHLNYFCLTDYVSPNLSAHLLSKFIPHCQSLCKTTILKCFFRICYSLSNEESLLNEIYRQILHFLFPNHSSSIREELSVAEQFILFLKDSMCDKTIISNILQPYFSILKDNKSNNICQVYHVGTWLIKYNVLNSVSVNAIIQSLFTSKTLRNTDIQLNSNQEKIMKSVLPDIILGLSSETLTNFTSRILKDIFIIYLPRFDGKDHPVLKTLCHSETLTSYFLNVVKSENLIEQSKHFLRQIIDSNLLSHLSSNMMSLFFTVLFVPFVNQRFKHRDKESLVILKTMIPTVQFESSLPELMASIIGENMAYRMGDVFELLTILPSFIVTELLPLIEHHVVITEVKRGVTGGPHRKALEELKKKL